MGWHITVEENLTCLEGETTMRHERNERNERRVGLFFSFCYLKRGGPAPTYHIVNHYVKLKP